MCEAPFSKTPYPASLCLYTCSDGDSFDKRTNPVLSSRNDTAPKPRRYFGDEWYDEVYHRMQTTEESDVDGDNINDIELIMRRILATYW